MSKADRERLYVVEDDVTGHVEVDCFMDEMKTFYQVSTPSPRVGTRYIANRTLVRLRESPRRRVTVSVHSLI